MPLQHRHTYAADLRCGLRADEKDTDRRSRPSAKADKRALLSRPASPRLEPVRSIERLLDAGSSRTPSRFACRARTVWECRPASSLSGLLPALPCTSRVRLPSASPACCDRPEAGPFHPHPVSWRLVAHLLVEGEHHCLLPRVEIKADHIDQLFLETRIIGHLERVDPPRLEQEPLLHGRVLWVEELSSTTCTSRPTGTAVSISARNSMNSAARCRRRVRVTTCPVATSALRTSR